MLSIPNNSQIEFFLLPVPLLALIAGTLVIIITFLLIKKPNVRPYFKPLFRFYYYLSMVPIYLGAVVVYGITLGRVNTIEKLKEANFFEKFKKVYLSPKEFFEDMRLNPSNYYVWIGFYICFFQIALDYILIIWITELLYGGKDSIIFGILSADPPSITNPIIRWVFMATIGPFIWIPTKFFIQFIASIFHNYDNSDEPERPWYDKARLLYIGWAYILTADMVWCLGMVLTLVVYIFIPSWEVLIFTWVCVIICGIIELTYQQYSIQGLFKMKWYKAFPIWLLSMLPFMIMTGLLVYMLGSQINLLFS